MVYVPYCVLYGVLCIIWLMLSVLTHGGACGGQRLTLDVFLFSTLFYFMYINVLPAFMSVYHICLSGACEGQKKLL